MGAGLLRESLQLVSAFAVRAALLFVFAAIPARSFNVVPGAVS